MLLLIIVYLFGVMNMINKMEIDMIIALIQSVVTMIETYNPNLASNPIIAELQKAIAGIQALGL